jgi:hypothetical protein
MLIMLKNIKENNKQEVKLLILVRNCGKTIVR